MTEWGTLSSNAFQEPKRKWRNLTYYLLIITNNTYNTSTDCLSFSLNSKERPSWFTQWGATSFPVGRDRKQVCKIHINEHYEEIERREEEWKAIHNFLVLHKSPFLYKSPKFWMLTSHFLKSKKSYAGQHCTNQTNQSISWPNFGQ